MSLYVSQRTLLKTLVFQREFERVARIELAIALYARGVLSLGQARRLAKLSKWELLEELAKRGVERHYTREELEDDINFAEE